MRMFVALPLPEAVKNDLSDFLESRQEAGTHHVGLRWTAPSQWHVTLAFLPEVADRHTDELFERLQRIAARRNRLVLRVAGAGAFPHAGRAKVIWAGLEHEGESEGELEGEHEDLGKLATGVRAAAAKSGIKVDGGRFRPHLTLARLGRPGDVTRWLRVLDPYAGPSWQAHEVALIASYLGQGPNGRPRHEVAQTFELGPPGTR
jgi:RNA 2',3'-cyclic 3'-phosphodiesterase